MNRKKKILISLLVFNILAVSGLFYFYISDFNFLINYIVKSNINDSSVVPFERDKREIEDDSEVEEQIIYAERKNLNDHQVNLLSTDEEGISINTDEINIDNDSSDNKIMVQPVDLRANSNYILTVEIESDSDESFVIELGSEDKSFFIKETLTTNKPNTLILNNADSKEIIVYITLYFEIAATYEIIDFHLERNDYANTIAVNQLGYLPEMNKVACFDEYEGSYFEVVNAENGEVVYKAGISSYIYDEKTETFVGYGDFSEIKESGIYYIRSQYGNYSYEFRIDSDIYSILINDALKMISTQRCGTDLPESIYGEFAHEACHDHSIEAIELGFRFKANGGWHDAGDYGRYTSTTNKTLIDLIMSYIVGNELYDDNMNILESGNNISDILDEIKFGCDYLLSIQLNNGSVFEKIITESFADWQMPDDDLEQLYAFPPTTINTAYSAGILMLTSELFKDIDSEYSESCKDSALKALEYVEDHKFIGIRRFDEFSNNGHYSDSEDLSERYFMYIIFGLVLNDDEYIAKAVEIMGTEEIDVIEVDFYNPSAYASYLFVKNYQGEEFSEYVDIIIKEFVDVSNKIIETAYENAYFNSTNDYYWGSNYNVTDKGIILGFTYDICDQEIYSEFRDYQLHYVLGNNILGTSFISGYGDIFPKNVHHRICYVKDTYLTGAMVGGANQDREINEGSDIVIDTPAKDYVDDYSSYSTNEISIYYNSSLELLLALINS